MFGKNCLKIFGSKIKPAAVVFSGALLFCTTTYAQSINDDLKSSKTKETSAKPKSSAAAGKARTVRKTTAQRPRRMQKVFVARPSVNPSAAVPQQTYSAPVSRPTAAKSLVRQPAAPPPATTYVPRPAGGGGSETADQILTRYMNFRQTASVTPRHWNSVIIQTSKTLQENPNHSIARAQSLIAQGELSYGRRDYFGAINNFKAALQILPKSALPHYSLGKAYLANGQAKLAEDSFKEALDQNKNFALAYKGLGDAFAAQGEQKTAVKYYKKSTETASREGNRAF